MAIHVALHHRTQYRYDRLVNLGPQVVRLRPAPHSRTRILSYSLRIQPAVHFLNWQQDPQSNHLARLMFPEPTREFVVEVDLVAEMAVFNPFDFFLEPGAETFPFTYAASMAHEIEPYLLLQPLTPKFAALVERVRREDLAKAPVRTIDFLVALNQRLWREVRYLIRLEPGVQTPEETLEKSSGSCRDSAWLLCQLLRHLGLASRFVSGYLIQLAADVKSLDGPSGTDRDFTDLHAWCEVYLPGAGWIGLDPTSGLLAGEGHIPLAATPDPQSAAPITGAVDECECEFGFEMRVTRIHESPRVTLPYSDEQWREIERLGHQVDGDLTRYDCRLTMGGEPTFVGIDDVDAPEWNTTAMGPAKTLRAEDLMRRLKARMTTGAFLHFGQGKWYPGESLPRWAYGCYWRKDGEATWVRPELLADVNRDYGFTDTDSAQFIAALAERLGCGSKWILPAYEDIWYYLWRERRLPTNVDPLQSRLKEEEERARLSRIFEQGLGRIAGHTLPLRRGGSGEGSRWVSGPWFFRAERMYLIPGDSPMGLRLPLDSLPWVSEADYPYLNPQDPMEPRRELPLRASWVAGRLPVAAQVKPALIPRPQGMGFGSGAIRDAARGGDTARPERGESAGGLVRTAVCVEPRGGRLHVFMPPVETLEDYLELVTAVEETAAALDRPVVLEGYTPPHDPRLNVLKVTPDPGVIEVNIHPAHTWDDLVRNTEVLYEEARLARLGTEKFMLDGRHSGTGGGNHIVLGGATPADSPLLRRPDLLRSLITFWQNHPSLSFLFSGMFIGPTSQNPRVDEARHDALRELEIAFRQVPEFGYVQPWLVDRLFRNLLVDASGNTHRAEFSVDKLYSPDSSSGRLGLLELRAFEMPPHARMSLAQQLLLRTLISRFWKTPYDKPLVRWGTDIHDRWMLPHFVWQDLEDVMADLQSSGYPMKAEWFAPHFEFRFPMIGDVAARSVSLEIRQALEPWHVLGEEGGGGGTVRYVDSSLERLQVRVRGMVDSRHVVCVGGTALPLHSTGTNGEFVAGVRYRAWQPTSCLHPTIGVHTPLVFDIVDQWNGRSVGGCTYHVMHPGGRNYNTFPVNAYEAESRRLARFFRQGHTPGSLQPRVPDRDPDFPFTLDLRRT
ncbi:MAG: transglutaminase family protein [Verrucomicrobiales bacterium]|nr:transglutaminase family protein [Verrucomicrobiales bacterium]